MTLYRSRPIGAQIHIRAMRTAKGRGQAHPDGVRPPPSGSRGVSPGDADQAARGRAPHFPVDGLRPAPLPPHPCRTRVDESVRRASTCVSSRRFGGMSATLIDARTPSLRVRVTRLLRSPRRRVGFCIFSPVVLESSVITCGARRLPSDCLVAMHTVAAAWVMSNLFVRLLTTRHARVLVSIVVLSMIGVGVGFEVWITESVPHPTQLPHLALRTNSPRSS